MIRHSFKMRALWILSSLYLCSLAAAQDMRVPPSIIKQEIKCLYKEGEQMCVYRGDGEVIIECEASGYPDPTYKWYKNGEVLDLSAPNIKGQGTAGGIVISPATSLDEGYYQCRAENAYGTALGMTFQMVKATLGSYPPDIPVQEYSARPGEPLKISCNPIKSVPSAVFTWGIANGPVDDNPQKLDFSQRINVDPNGNLYFSYLEDTDDYGGKLYKCNVYNAQLDFTAGGSLSKINMLNRGEAPPVEPSGTFSTASPHIALVGKDMTLQCLFSGSRAPSITWNRINGQLPQGRIEQRSFNTQLKVRSIREEDEGTYRCTGSNTAGRADQDIFVKVEASPVFKTRTTDVRPLNTNATNEGDVTFNCKPYAIPMATTQWLMNGVPIDAGNPPERISISDDSQSLTISKVCKDCTGERATDLMVIQCNASNVHGYAFGDGYLNVLLPTMITIPPPEELQVDVDTVLELPCEATSDDSTPMVYQWLYDDQKIILDPPFTNINDVNTLIIDTNGLDGEDWKNYAGKYTCKVSNGYSTVAAESLVKLPPGTKPITGAGVGGMWWIFLIIALVLLLLILLLCCCLWMQRNKGDTYPVDEKERKNGNDPEKELADSGFADYQRPEDEPTKGSRASLSSTIKMDSDDEGSLAEYGDIDTGKFNEDGSFIGQYMEKNKAPQDTTV